MLLLQELGEQRNPFYSMALLHIGDVALNQGDYPQAGSRYEECLALKRETGDVWGVAQTVNNLGEVAQCEADYERAEGLYNEALELFKDLGSPLDIARSVHNLAYVGFHRGDPYRATELFTESLRLYSEQLNTRGISECLMGLAGVACAQGKTGVLKAVRLLSAAEAHFEVSGTAMWPADRIEYEDNLARARAQLREEIFQSEWREGRSMNTEDAMNYALERGLS